MPKYERLRIQLDDGDGNRLEADWSRSGKHLTVTVIQHGKRGLEWDLFGQILLTPKQVEELRDFMAQRPE